MEDFNSWYFRNNGVFSLKYTPLQEVLITLPSSTLLTNFTIYLNILLYISQKNPHYFVIF